MSKAMKITVIALLLVVGFVLSIGAGCALGPRTPPSSSQGLDIVAEAWEKHQQISLHYFKILQDYIENYYDPNANYGIYVRTMWLLRDDIMAQKIFSETPNGPQGFEMTIKLGVLHCRKAFENYQMTKDAESLFYGITMASEVLTYAETFDIELPSEALELLNRMVNEKKPPTVEEARQAFIQSLITGLKPGDPLWMREIVKVIKPVDPIREHFIRSKGIDGLGDSTH